VSGRIDGAGSDLINAAARLRDEAVRLIPDAPTRTALELARTHADYLEAVNDLVGVAIDVYRVAIVHELGRLDVRDAEAAP
jgi:hypothetical protein